MNGKLKLGFFGLGNFGGQVANALIAELFDCVAMNASTQDLELLHEGVTPFLIGDGRGTGKSRDTAKEFLIDHISVVQDEIITKFISDHDAIVIAGSAGGGFGSGATTQLADILGQIYPDKAFIVITTFPSLSETYTAQNHAEQFMRELIALEVPYLVYDNEEFHNLEASEMNAEVIRCIVNDMKILRGDFIMPTNAGGIDERDLLTVISTPGRIVTSQLLNLDTSQIPERLVEALRKNITGHAQLADDHILSASALMYNFNLPDLKSYAVSITEDLQNTFGIPVADYRNEAVDNNECESFIVQILAGLTPPSARIDRIVNRRLQMEREINERKAATMKLNNVQSGGIKLGVKSFGQSKPKDSQAVDEILKKFVQKK